MWDIAADETSEMPVSWTRHGAGVGFGNCGRITMPLAPNLGLIIHRTNRPDLRKLDAVSFNRATIYNSREFIAHHPDGLPGSGLRFALLKDLRTWRYPSSTDSAWRSLRLMVVARGASHTLRE